MERVGSFCFRFEKLKVTHPWKSFLPARLIFTHRKDVRPELIQIGTITNTSIAVRTQKKKSGRDTARHLVGPSNSFANLKCWIGSFFIDT